MKKWLAIVPAAAGAGVAAFLIAKKAKSAPKAEAKPVKKAEKAAPAVIKNAKTAVYSFASGYKDAKTVNVSLRMSSESPSRLPK